ncbi:MAG: hypothetical protein AB7G20_09775, partial [Sulfurimonas sp.]|uniref:hypothetical protein n=1 Tax=Sulfurimonas sp. TaxID=2022749 RepID=UPI003D152989
MTKDNLYFFNPKNLQEPVLFHFVLAESPFLMSDNYWAPWPKIEENEILVSVESYFIYYILHLLQSANSAFDEYGVTDYYAQSAIKLHSLIKTSIEENIDLDEITFRKKYDNSFDFLNDMDNECLVSYNDETDFQKIKSEIQLILHILY